MFSRGYYPCFQFPIIGMGEGKGERYAWPREDRTSRRAEFNDRGYLANITYHEIRERDHNVK